jgi:hypothetical protein
MSQTEEKSKDSPLCITGTLGPEWRTIAIDTSEVNATCQAIAALFEPGTLERVPHELLDRIKGFALGGGLEVCVTPFTAASSTDHHVIGLRVGGELEEIAVAARAVKLGLNVGGVGHSEAFHVG